MSETKTGSSPALSRRALLGGAAAWLAACREERPPINMWFGGDVHLGDSLRAPLTQLQHKLHGIGFINLEGPIGSAPSSSTSAARPQAIERGKVQLHNSADAVGSLYPQGVRVASIANNHAADLGSAGARHTRETLINKRIQPSHHEQAATISVHGRQIVVASYELSPAFSVPAALQALTTTTTSTADLIVVSFHVTGPPSYLPRPRLRDAVGLALGAGARVVVCHGSHAMGPVERRGNAVIAWGLGNLLFNCDCTKEQDGLILRITMPHHQRAASAGNRANAVPIRANVLPIKAGLDGAEAQLADNPKLQFDLLEAIGSTPLRRRGVWAEF